MTKPDIQAQRFLHIFCETKKYVKQNKSLERLWNNEALLTDSNSFKIIFYYSFNVVNRVIGGSELF